MMSTHRIWAVVAAVTLLAFAATARELPKTRPDRAGMSAERLDRIAELARGYTESGKLAGVLTMVARDGRVVHVSAVGQRGVYDDRPLPEDALFRIFSMSKSITAAAAMMLYEEGKFQLGDPVSKFIPELAELDVLVDGERVPAKNVMTMQQLLTHTAGFSYGFAPDDPVDKLYNETQVLRAKDLDEFIERLAALPLKYEPGTQWHYSVAVDVTGAVIERISGQSFGDFLQERLFDPLDMRDTFFQVPPDKMDRFLPNHGWDAENNKLVVFDDSEFMDYTGGTMMESGGGGLVSTARDYLRFAEMMRAGGELHGVRILSPKTVEFMAADHLPGSIDAGGEGERPVVNLLDLGSGFGLGFGVVRDPVLTAVIGSPGEYSWGGAAGTIFWIDPVEEIVVVSMIQLMGSPWPLRAELKVLSNAAIMDLK